MSTSSQFRAAPLTFVTEDLVRRGQEIARRRAVHRIHTVAEFARMAGVDRQTVVRAEAGRSTPASLQGLEDCLDELDEREGIDSRSAMAVAQGAETPGPVEFDVTGPKTEWHVVVRGPAELADELRRQVVELLRDIEPPESPGS